MFLGKAGVLRSKLHENCMSPTVALAFLTISVLKEDIIVLTVAPKIQMTCTNGTYELTTTCADKKTCFWDKGTGEAECVEDEDDETTILWVQGIALEPNSGCFPNFKIGALCGTDPEIEGEMRCDDTCTNIVCDYQPLV